MNSFTNLSDNNAQLTGLNESNDEQLFDLSIYWNAIKRAKWSIVAITLCVALIGGIIATNMIPVYQATSKILADPIQPKPNGEETNISSALVVLFYQTQYEIIRSRYIAESVVDELGLVEKYKTEQNQINKVDNNPFMTFIDGLKDKFELAGITETNDNQEDASNSEIKSILTEQIVAGLKVSGGKQSKIINISYASNDPVRATNIVNAVSDAYISFGLTSRLDEVKNTEKWLVEQYNKLSQTLQRSEVALSDYRMTQGLVDTSQQQTLESYQLQNLNNELVKAQTKLSIISQQYQTIKNITPGSIQSYSLPAVLENQIAGSMIKERADRAREVDQLEQRYGELHPKMISARAALKSTTDNLNNEIAKIISNIETSYQAALAQVSNIQRLIKERKSEIQNLQGDNLELVRLEREVENNRRVYESFQNQLMQANINSEFNATNVRIIDRAVVPDFPIEPRKKNILLIATMLGLVLGVVFAILRGVLDKSINSPEAVERKLMVPCLGFLPLVKKTRRGFSPEEQYINDKRSVFSEKVNTIRTSLLYSNVSSTPQTVLVTSSEAQEGKSTLSINLATAYSQLGNTLLLECDMRKPSLDKYLNIKQDIGISEMISNGSVSESTLQNYQINENLSVILAGSNRDNPTELLLSQHFANVLNQLKNHFEYIIVDSPPSLPVSDTLIIGDKMDAIVMAIKANDTKIQMVKEAQKRLILHKAKLTAVLTMADPKKMNEYGYSYNDDQYYGELTT